MSDITYQDTEIRVIDRIEKTVSLEQLKEDFRPGELVYALVERIEEAEKGMDDRVLARIGQLEDQRNEAIRKNVSLALALDREKKNKVIREANYVCPLCNGTGGVDEKKYNAWDKFNESQQ